MGRVYGGRMVGAVESAGPAIGDRFTSALRLLPVRRGSYIAVLRLPSRSGRPRDSSFTAATRPAIVCTVCRRPTIICRPSVDARRSSTGDDHLRSPTACESPSNAVTLHSPLVIGAERHRLYCICGSLLYCPGTDGWWTICRRPAIICRPSVDARRSSVDHLYTPDDHL